MPIEELEQALQKAKWGNAEEDVIEVIARILELPREAVVRVQYAFHAAQNMRLGSVYLGEDEIPVEVQDAIKKQVKRGFLRTHVRECIRDEKAMYADVKSLVKKPVDVCKGCQFSLACVTNSYSTPKECFKKGVPVRIEGGETTPVRVLRFSNGGALVRPTRIRGDLVTVECGHPYGTFDVDVGELWP
jgi:hypothetical protein